MAIADENYRRYVRDRDNGHIDFVKLALKCDEYYRGEQWAEEDLAKLNASKRPALTINEVLPTVNTVLGEQTQQRANIVYKPVGDGTSEVAEVITKVALHIWDDNSVDYQESQVFADGIIMGRGFFDIRMDFSDNINGEVRIVADDPLNIVIDSDAKDYDPKTWKGVSETKWLSLDDITLTYGKDKADELRGYVACESSYGSDSIELGAPTFGGTEGSTGVGEYAGGEAETDGSTIRRVRVVERQHRKLSLVEYFVDQEHGDMRQVPEHWNREKRRAFAAQWGLGLIKKTESRIRWTATADHVVLHDSWSPYKRFTKIPYFAYFRRGKPFGLVRNLISPQDQLNKVSSQELHVVNTTANSGWITEAGSLTNMDGNELAERGAETGLHIEYAQGRAVPEKIQPNQIPNGLDRISQKAEVNMRRISGVNESMTGNDKSEVSGVAMADKRSRGFVMLNVPFDNLTRTRNMLAEHVLELVQQFYTEGRVFQLTNYSNPEEPDEKVEVNQMTPEGEVINDLTLGEYKVVVTSAPARDTFDEGQFAEAISLREIGVMIPDDAIIEYSHLSKKHALAERLRAQMGMGKLTPEQQAEQEMQRELTIRRIVAEIAEIEATSTELEARAQLNMAKAQEAVTPKPGEPGSEGMDGQQEMQIAREEMELKLQQKREELAMQRQNKLDELRNALVIAEMANHAKGIQAGMEHRAQQVKINKDDATKRFGIKAKAAVSRSSVKKSSKK
jgi:hypothetical protein